MNNNPHVTLMLTKVYIAPEDVYDSQFNIMFTKGTVFGQDSTGHWFYTVSNIVKARWRELLAAQEALPEMPYATFRDYWRSINASPGSPYMQSLQAGIQEVASVTVL